MVIAHGYEKNERAKVLSPQVVSLKCDATLGAHIHQLSIISTIVPTTLVVVCDNDTKLFGW